MILFNFFLFLFGSLFISTLFFKPIFKFAIDSLLILVLFKLYVNFLLLLLFIYETPKEFDTINELLLLELLLSLYGSKIPFLFKLLFNNLFNVELNDLFKSKVLLYL